MAYELQELSHRHEGLMNALLANPHMTIKELAAVVNYTPTYVSMLVNSDMFQAELKKRSKEVGLVLGVSVVEKERAAYSMVLEDTMQRIESGKATERFITDTLKSLAPSTRPAVSPLHFAPQVNISVSAERIEALREKAAAVKQGSTSLKGSESPVVVETEPLSVSTEPVLIPGPSEDLLDARFS